jgi:hypothetical protein
MPTPLLSAKSAARLALLATSVGALACLWTSWCEFPGHAWNEVRLAPAFALRHGINPYPPLGGGPLFTWIYGPVGLLINLPATFATSPAGALQLASLINALVVLAPLAVVLFASEELRARGPAIRWLALSLGVLLVPRLNLVVQVADHAAIALGLLSCWCLARRAHPTAAQLASAAALGALAVWAKQTALFLLPAQIAFLLLGRERAAVTRYFAWFAGFNLLGLAIVGQAFGFANLWLNLVDIPGRLPLQWSVVPARIALRSGSLVAQLVLPSLGLLALWFKGPWPARNRESGRFFQLVTLAYIAMLPVGLAAFLKIGGDINSFQSWDYLLPGCLLAWLAADHVTAAAPVRLLAATVLALALHGTRLFSVPARPFVRHFDAAAQLTATCPHAIWFPQNPLITLYADQELWHSEDGILTRYAAGYGLRESDFRRYLPRHLQIVAYAANVDPPLAPPLLPEFNYRTSQGYWILYTRAPQPPGAR